MKQYTTTRNLYFERGNKSFYENNIWIYFRMNNYVIQEWEASYYCWENRVWKYGKLAICSNCICFFESKDLKIGSDKPNATVAVELGRVTGFQRKLASLLYKAVVVLAGDAKPLWFSSLQNREETYYFLEHFWQQRLLLGLGYSRREAHQKNRGTGMLTTSDKDRRQKLFKVLYDSETTLTKAADSMYDQGGQLEHSSRTMNAMHRDLAVAETLLNGLDRWFTRWDINPEYFHEISLKKEFPVLYRLNIKESFYPGSLVLTGDQVTVLNAKRVAFLTMLLKNLTNVVVSTPWSIALVRSVIGEPEFMVEISSAHVVYIVKALQRDHGDKFEYEEHSGHGKRVVDVETGTGFVSGELPDYSSASRTSEQPLGSRPLQQNQRKLSELDEADLGEVSSVVGNMRSLAIGIGQEMNRQLDRLDQLSESVDKANYRIEKDGRKLRDKL